MSFLFFTFFLRFWPKNSGMVTFSCFQGYLYKQSHLQKRVWKSCHERATNFAVPCHADSPVSVQTRRSLPLPTSLHARFIANGVNQGVPYNHVGKPVLSECMCMPICTNACLCAHIRVCVQRPESKLMCFSLLPFTLSFVS